MDEKIREIYKLVIQEKEKQDEAGQKVWREIMRLTKEESVHMKEKEYEQYRDKFFALALLAEEEGFVKGVRYGMELMFEIVAERK